LSFERDRHSSGTAADGRARWALLERIAPAIPALLLVIIAVNQIYLAHTRDLNPWKGGGFGMFSTSLTRHLHVFAIESGGEREVDLPEELEDLEERLRALPTDRRLDEFGRRLAEVLGEHYLDLAAVRVELWSTRYDVDDLTPETILIRDLEVEAPRRGTH
jgi:hypothetical protein